MWLVRGGGGVEGGAVEVLVERIGAGCVRVFLRSDLASLAPEASVWPGGWAGGVGSLLGGGLRRRGGVLVVPGARACWGCGVCMPPAGCLLWLQACGGGTSGCLAELNRAGGGGALCAGGGRGWPAAVA